MTDTTLTTVSGITFTFLPESMGDIDTIIDAQPENITIPGNGPAGNFNYDYEGVSKIIVLNGSLIEADTTRTSTGTVKTIEDQKKWLESVANGAQGALTFTSNYDSQSVSTEAGASSPYQASFSDTKVMIQNMRFKERSGKPSELPFTIALVVGN